MKNKQVKAADKTSKKKVKEEIGMAILNDLQKIAGKFKADSKKADKQIKKTAQRLAKKLSKGIKAENTSGPAIAKVDAPKAVKNSGDAQPKAETNAIATKAVATEPIKTHPAVKAKRGPKVKPASEPLK